MDSAVLVPVMVVANGTVLRLDQKVHRRMPLGPTPALLKLACLRNPIACLSNVLSNQCFLLKLLSKH
jgi:hypothetical protein